MEIKIFKDGFIWGIIPKEEAEEIFNSGNVDLHKIYTDDTEALIEHETDMIDAEVPEFEIGFAIGFKESLELDYAEACARNNDNRSFDQWLEAKANLILE